MCACNTNTIIRLLHIIRTRQHTKNQYEKLTKNIWKIQCMIGTSGCLRMLLHLLELELVKNILFRYKVDNYPARHYELLKSIIHVPNSTFGYLWSILLCPPSKIASIHHRNGLVLTSRCQVLWWHSSFPHQIVYHWTTKDNIFISDTYSR